MSFRDGESAIWLLETSTASAQVCCLLSGGQVPADPPGFLRFLLSAEFAVYQSFPFHSVSVETYEFNGDQFATFAQPDSGLCAVYVWDHVELVFRRFHNITCRFPGSGCAPTPLVFTLALALFQRVRPFSASRRSSTAAST